jgi:hypothetical protein
MAVIFVSVLSEAAMTYANAKDATYANLRRGPSLAQRLGTQSQPMHTHESNSTLNSSTLK